VREKKKPMISSFLSFVFFFSKGDEDTQLIHALIKLLIVLNECSTADDGYTTVRKFNEFLS